MPFHHRPPTPPLAPFVEALWCCENEPGPRRLERVLPSGSAQLIVNLKEDQTRSYAAAPGSPGVTAPGSILSGPATRFQIIDSDEQEQVVGVSFRPGGTLAFFALPAHELTDRDVPLEVLWGSRGTALLREQLLAAPSAEAKLTVVEHTLLAALRERSLHAAVAFAAAQFQRHPATTRIATVTDAVALSPRRFAERFELEVGMTPKRYCRVLRFQQALGEAHRARRVDWSQVALDCGFYDQSHLVNEFRAFAGLTPTAYLAARTSFQNHVHFFQDGVA